MRCTSVPDADRLLQRTVGGLVFQGPGARFGAGRNAGNVFRLRFFERIALRQSWDRLWSVRVNRG